MLRNFPYVSLEETGKNIKKLMLENGLTVLDIQEAMGFEYPQAIYKWFWGSSLPTIENLVVLASLFHTTIDKILIIKD